MAKIGSQGSKTALSSGFLHGFGMVVCVAVKKPL
jgi:hypothetical protein